MLAEESARVVLERPFFSGTAFVFSWVKSSYLSSSPRVCTFRAGAPLSAPSRGASRMSGRLPRYAGYIAKGCAIRNDILLLSVVYSVSYEEDVMATQLESARAGIVTDEMRKAAASEPISAEQLRELIAEGLAVLPRNINHSFP